MLLIHIRLVCSSWRWNLPWDLMGFFQSTDLLFVGFGSFCLGQDMNVYERISWPEKEKVPLFEFWWEYLSENWELVTWTQEKFVHERRVPLIAGRSRLAKFDMICLDRFPCMESNTPGQRCLKVDGAKNVSPHPGGLDCGGEYPNS